MALNWCYNEPWPSAANNSIINYPVRPKPGYNAVKEACRPFMASARLEKFAWKEGESFTAELWMLNDVYQKSQPQKVKVYAIAGDQKIELLTWEVKSLAENTNLAGPTVRFVLPEWDVDMFTLSLEVEGKPQYNSQYQFVYRPLVIKKAQGAPTMNL
jgi:beta-mannosidase